MKSLLAAVAVLVVSAIWPSEGSAAPNEWDALEEHIATLSDAEKKKAMVKLREIADGIEIKLASQQESSKAWYKKIKIRRSSFDKNSISKPASIQYTNPKDGDTSYDVNIGVTLPVADTDRLLFGPKVEYHRNTNIEKEQDTFQGGVVASVLLGSVVSDPNSQTVKPALSLWADGELEYKRDEVKDTESWQISEMLTPLNPDWGLGGPLWLFNGHLPVRFDAAAGAEYEDIFDGGDNKDGETLRGTARGGIVFFPLYASLGGRFQVGASSQYWTEFSHSGDFDDGKDNFDNVTVYVNYYFDEDQQVGLGISYVNGDDPSEGLLNQAYTQFGLVIKTGE